MGLFLNEAKKINTSKFIISGKTLHRWLEPNICKNFEETLLEIISRKTQIVFVIYHCPDNIQKKKGLQSFLYNKIFPYLIETCGLDLMNINEVFSIYEVDSLPYLYAEIDNQIIITQYFNHSSNAENLMFVFESKCPFAYRYQNDFNCIIKNNISNLWIQDFLKNEVNK